MKTGLLLVLVGFLFLLNNLGLLPDIDWSVIWPVLIIVIGICLMLEKKQ